MTISKPFSALASSSAFRLCQAETSRHLIAAAHLGADALLPESSEPLRLASGFLEKAARLSEPRRDPSAGERSASLWARSRASALLARASAAWLRSLALSAAGASWEAVAAESGSAFRLGLEAERAEEASGAPMSRPASSKASLAQAGLLEALALARLGEPSAAALASERLETALLLSKSLPEPAKTEAARSALAWGGAALWLCGERERSRAALFESAALGAEGLQSIPGGIPEGVIPA